LDPWLNAAQPSGALQANGTASVNLQVSAAGLSIGTYLGRIRLATGALAQDVLVTLHVSTAPSSMSILSGNNATASVGATLPPLIVSLVDANGTPIPGVPVNFAVASGGGELNTRTAMSDSTGKASAVLTLPASPGSVQVVASA